MHRRTRTTFAPRSIARSLLACALAASAVAATPAGAAAAGSTAVAWGENYQAQLDAGYKSTYEEDPVPVLELSGITALAAGNGFSLALLENGTVRAWGGNTWGQLGDGTHSGTWGQRLGTVAVQGLTGVKAIAAADAHPLALLENGTVEAWGNDNYGQLGDGSSGTENRTADNQTLAKAVPGLSHVIAIAAGGGSDYALLANHTLLAWGLNNAGQLGIGEVGPETCLFEEKKPEPCSKVPRPVGTPLRGQGTTLEVQPLREVIAVAAAAESGYALLADHRLDAWGSNELGQLGTGGELKAKVAAPEPVFSAAGGSPVSAVSTVAAGGEHALALLEDGEVLGWGANVAGESGNVASQTCNAKKPCVPRATAIPGLRHVSDVAAGDGFSLAVSGGTVYAFGQGSGGQLGDGGTTSSATPVAVSGIGPVSSVVAGKTHALALLAPGVQQPAPPLSVQPGLDALKVTWSVRAKQVRLRDRVAKASGKHQQNKILEQVTIGEGQQGFTFGELLPQSYEVNVAIQTRGASKSRIVIASPLG
jgi:alpha-tubulin suppressor-like RCC1 family protein